MTDLGHLINGTYGPDVVYRRLDAARATAEQEGRDPYAAIDTEAQRIEAEHQQERANA